MKWERENNESWGWLEIRKTATRGVGVHGVCDDSEDPSLEKNGCRVAFVQKRRTKHTSTRGILSSPDKDRLLTGASSGFS